MLKITSTIIVGLQFTALYLLLIELVVITTDSFTIRPLTINGPILNLKQNYNHATTHYSSSCNESLDLLLLICSQRLRRLWRRRRYGDAPFLSSTSSSSSLSSATKNQQVQELELQSLLEEEQKQNDALSVETEQLKRTAAIEDSVKIMSVREIKQELLQFGIQSNTIFEKKDLIQVLVEARLVNSSQSTINNTSEQKVTTTTTSQKTNSDKDNTSIQIPLYFTSLTNQKIASVNGNYGITADTREQPYPTIRIQGTIRSQKFPLSLLVDTACSGFVLKPETLTKYNLPKLQTPVTMTGAAGTTSNTGLTQIDSLLLFDDESSKTTTNSSPISTVHGPIPIAVQEINALPKALDGIIGLSFLNQFTAIDWNFQSGTITFHRTSSSKQVLTPLSEGGEREKDNIQYNIFASAPLSMIPRLGIYTINVYFGNRGPITMLFDTGASSSLLNWYGVQQLGLSKSSSSINPIPMMGAIGSDNIAMQLTHRLYVSSYFQFGSKTQTKTNTNTTNTSSSDENNNEGLVLNGQRIPKDIGQIPFIDQLPGIGGILGIDIIMKCSAIRIMLKDSSNRHVQFYS